MSDRNRDENVDETLSPGSTAHGSPTRGAEPGSGEKHPEPTGPSQHNPDALIEGNRVGTPDDME